MKQEKELNTIDNLIKLNKPNEVTFKKIESIVKSHPTANKINNPVIPIKNEQNAQDAQNLQKTFNFPTQFRFLSRGPAIITDNINNSNKTDHQIKVYSDIDEIPFKIEITPNTKIDYKNSVLINSLTKYEKCNKKSGILFNVFEISKTTNKLITKPIYISLDNIALNIYNNDNIKDGNSLEKSVTLKDISKISKSFNNTNCFDIDTLISKKPETIILCAESTNIMIEWIDAIKQLKECNVKIKLKEMNFDFLNGSNKPQVTSKIFT